MVRRTNFRFLTIKKITNMQFIYSEEEKLQIDQYLNGLRILTGALEQTQENFKTIECTENCTGCIFKGTIISQNVCLMRRYIDKSLAPSEEVKINE